MIVLPDKKIELLLSSDELTRGDIKDIVKYCKSLLESRTNIKWKICDIANKICNDVKNNKVSKFDYTRAQFARDIGIAEKTLWRWHKEYKVLYSKVKEKDLKDLKRKQIEAILGKVNEKSKKSDVLRLVKEQQKVSPEDVKLLDYLYRANNIHFFITKSVLLKNLDRSKLLQLKSVLKSTVTYIEKNLNTEVDLKKKKQSKAIEEVRKALGVVNG